MTDTQPDGRSQPAVQMRRFSTDDFPAHKRIEAYREIYGRTIIRHDIEPVEDQEFRFDGTLYSLPNLGLASYVVTPCRAPRGPQHLDSDDLVLTISLGGDRLIRQNGREAVMRAGEAALTTSADPGLVTIASTCQLVSLRLASGLLRSRIVDFDACLVRTVPEKVAALKLLIGYLGAIQDTEALTPLSLRSRAVTHVYDLVALILGTRGEERKLAVDRGARAARLDAILREIERRSGDASLDVAAVAKFLGITPRYVHLILEDTGKSFTHHVLEQRLEKAATLLRDPRQCRRKIADIATEAGFTDLSYFNRAFRRHFGATPSDIRTSAGDRVC